jgi:hypothetical protein
MFSIWNIDLGTRRRTQDATPGSGVTAVFDHGDGVSWIGVDAAVQSRNGTRVSAARERSP